MSDVIKLLPDSVANQIAAGEVIQRPASVIKELVENAIDAKATSVQIVLKDAGRTLIQVIDNGVGMSDTDARLAFERHSTSKIRCADDLFTLHTMGFRGEALASIAAISQVELRTRRHGEALGTRLIIHASNCESQEPDMCPEGSNFAIKNLFFNVPARRKFLKSNQVELANIVREFEKLALVNYDVEFSLMHNGTVLYKLLPGTALQRITSLEGRNIEQQLLPICIDTGIVKISGYVGKPMNARRRNFLQFMFVNGRFMRHPYFHKAILSAYDQLIPKEEQPNYFLHFSVDPQSIDVNIHPTKTEIKFEDEINIWQILAAGVKEALGRFSEVPSIDFDNENAPEIPAYNPHAEVHKPEIDVDRSYNPFRTGQGSGSLAHGHSNVAANTDWEQLYRDFERKANAPDENLGHEADFQVALPDESDSEAAKLLDTAEQPLYIQMKMRFILSPIRSGLMIVDQHRAHVRILYNSYMQRLSQATMTSQSVIFPEVIHLTAAQNVVLNSLVDEMEQMGFVLNSCGENEWSIDGVPGNLNGVNTSKLVLQILDDIDCGSHPDRKQVVGEIALAVATAAAIPYGRQLMQEEMDILVADLLKQPDAKFAPDGKPIIQVIPYDQIAKMF